jgi:hypothetical protein
MEQSRRQTGEKVAARGGAELGRGSFGHLILTCAEVFGGKNSNVR